MAVTLIIHLVKIHNASENECKNIPLQSEKPTVYRTLDGAYYGTGTNKPMQRLLLDNYDWNNAPDPADISDSLDFVNETLSKGRIQHEEVTSMVWLWGQFIDHMIVHTSQKAGSYLYTGRDRVPTRKTEAIVDKKGVRQQINNLTPYLDASTVYGSSEEQAWSLRSVTGKGLLRTSTSHLYHNSTESYMLPVDQNRPGHWLAGDSRAEEHPALTAMHTLWVREHNYWAKKLAEEHTSWDSDTVYNTARHIVIGEIQAITYREWLPVLLGDEYLIRNKPCYNRGRTPATIYNEFATSIYRFGHSMVQDCLEYRDVYTGDYINCTLLKDSFFQNDMNEGILHEFGVGSFLLGASLQIAKQREPRIVDSMRVHLFVNSSEGELALDLAAINVARGRDHGVSSFQQLFFFSRGRQLSSCYDITESEATCEGLKKLYGDDLLHSPIDPWVGILCERNKKTGVLGKVGAHIVELQFNLLRNSDPYFYLWDNVILRWRAEIHTTKLHDIIVRNTEVGDLILPHNVFTVQQYLTAHPN